VRTAQTVAISLLLGVQGLAICGEAPDHPSGMYCGGNQLIDEGRVTAKVITGIVVDPAGGEIAAARVQIQRVGRDGVLKEVASDDLGRFRVHRLPPGDYWLGVSTHGMNLHYWRWTIPRHRGGTSQLRVQLTVGT